MLVVVEDNRTAVICAVGIGGAGLVDGDRGLGIVGASQLFTWL